MIPSILLLCPYAVDLIKSYEIESHLLFSYKLLLKLTISESKTMLLVSEVTENLVFVPGQYLNKKYNFDVVNQFRYPGSHGRQVASVI